MGAGTSAGAVAARRRAKAARLREQGQRLLDRADSLERNAESWAKGQDGERLVGGMLDRLQQHGWEVLHDVRWPGRPRANIDHLAVGPGGVLVVDAKNWSGTVSVSDGRLRQNGFRRDSAVVGVAKAGQAVAEQLSLPWNLHVVPVLCTTQALAGGPQRVEGVTILSADEIAPWALQLTPQLTSVAVAGISEHLRGALVDAALPAQRVATSAFGTTRRPRRATSSHRRRRGRRPAPARRGSSSRAGMPLLIARLALLLAVVIAGPTALKLWMDHSDDAVRQVMPRITAPSPSVPAAFDSCRDLRKRHPGGVRSPGDRNDGRKLAEKPAVDAAAAVASRRLDKDRDGLVCEVARSRKPR